MWNLGNMEFSRPSLSSDWQASAFTVQKVDENAALRSNTALPLTSHTSKCNNADKKAQYPHHKTLPTIYQSTLSFIKNMPSGGQKGKFNITLIQ